MVDGEDLTEMKKYFRKVRRKTELILEDTRFPLPEELEFKEEEQA